MLNSKDLELKTKEFFDSKNIKNVEGIDGEKLKERIEAIAKKSKKTWIEKIFYNYNYEYKMYFENILYYEVEINNNDITLVNIHLDEN